MLTQKIIAHRGIYDNIQIPENTLLAFKEALKHNLPIELDIHLTKDNKLVVFHDYTLERMTNQKLTIELLQIKDLENITLLNCKEKIPTLKEVLNLVNGKVPLLIEVKCKTGEKPIIKTLLNELNNYNGEVYIQSFNPKLVKILKRKKARYKIGLLINKNTNKKIWKIINYPYLCIKYIKPDFISIHKSLIQKKYIQKNTNKIPILLWTISNNEELTKLSSKYICICDNIFQIN